MNNKNLEKAMDIFAALIVGEEISLESGKNASLYEAYNSNSEVNDMVDLMLKKMNLHIYNYNYSLYVTSGDRNRVFGYSNEELKRMLSLRLNKELYLCYFIMYNIMTYFYSDSATYTFAEYIKLEDVINSVDNSLKNIISNLNIMVKNELEENSFETLALTWDELPVMSNEDTNGVRAGRGYKASFVKLTFNFLVSQSLMVEAEERYYPTNRFHALIKNYFEDERGRLFEMEQLAMTKEENTGAEY